MLKLPMLSIITEAYPGKGTTKFVWSNMIHFQSLSFDYTVGLILISYVFN